MNPQVTAGQIILGLGVAFLCGFIITYFYKWAYRGSNYTPSYVRSLLYLTLIAAMIIMVIGNNLARAFGLVGAMSIIRFRTALKDTQDIVFVFFSLAVGLAAGVGMYGLALGGTLAVGLVILITSRTNFAALNRKSYLVQFTFDDTPAANENAAASGNEAPYLDVFNRYARKHRLVNLRTAEGSDTLDLTYYVFLKDPKEAEALTRALGDIAQVSRVNVFYDEAMN
ncbi:MAG: DUF4956 domain-containing protein [Bacteroidota bacterium]